MAAPAPLAALADWLSHATGRRQRRRWVGNGRAHIEVRAVHRPGTGELARQVERHLTSLDGVRWARVNRVIGRVVVDHDDSVGDKDLVAAIEEVEREHGVDGEPFPAERPDHPGDAEPMLAQVAALLGDTAAMAGGAAARLLRRPPVRLDGLSAALTLADSVPRFRRELENRLGPSVTEAGLALGRAVTQALSERPFALSLDVAQRGLLIAELHARRRTWSQREPELAGQPPREPVDPLDLDERPCELDSGEAETHADRSGLAALLTAGTLLLGTRAPDLASCALQVGAPRAARMGKEAFAAQLGRVLADRGVVTLDGGVLRRLELVDTVVLDAEVVLTGGSMLGELAPLDGGGQADQVELRARAQRLFDPDRPRRRRRSGAWRMAPLEAFGDDLPRGAKRRARLLGRGATVLALAHRDRVVALVQAVPEIDGLAQPLADAIRRAGAELIVAGRQGDCARRLGAARQVAGGTRLAGVVRRLQAEGRAVALLSSRSGPALRAADCGIGVLPVEGEPPWSADLLCGPGLEEACLVMESVAAAARTSRRSAQLARYGSAAAGLLAVAGPRRGAAGRAALAVNGAAAVALAGGALSGMALGARSAPLPADSTPWHELPADAVLRRLGSSEHGLQGREVSRRRAAQAQVAGEAADDRERLARAMLEELTNPLTPVLATGAGVSAASGAVADSTLIASVMGGNAMLGGLQRLSADRAVRRLEGSNAARVLVRRDGEDASVSSDALVPGDVISVQAGDMVPADCRVLEASGLEVDESSLTGESLPVAKTAEPVPAAAVAERRSMLFAGSTVAAGGGAAVVVAVGRPTEAGRSLEETAEAPAPGGVEARLRSLTRLSVPLALGSGVAVVGAGLLRRVPLRESLSTGVGLALASVPEGLPLVATTAQLAAARRLSSRNAIVRNLRTVEALGRVQVLCFDKTGTLTEGRIRLVSVSDGRRHQPVSELRGPRRLVLAAALRATPPQQNGQPLAHSTDRAVVQGAETAGVAAEEGAEGWRPVNELPFEPSRGFHVVLGRCDSGYRLAVKGAPELVLPSCTSWRGDGDGGPVALDEAARRRLEDEVERLAGEGYRVLAVAERPASARTAIDERRVSDLELLGLVGLADAVRPTAAAAVAGLGRAGVDVVMITGDHPSTAKAIAAELRVLDGQRVLTGPEVDEMDDDALDRAVQGVGVFARMSPSHKVRVVKALRRAGKVVAVTGDGANDAPAIRLAHVGIALGDRATTAAREAADLVIADNRIETLIDAIIEGRAMWASVREAIAVLLGGNLGEIGFTVATGALAGTSPINARQLLVVNMLTDVLPSMALAVRAPRHTSPERLLEEGPDVSLGGALRRDIAIRAVATGTGASAAWWAARLSGTPARAQTVALVALVGSQLGQTIATAPTDRTVLGASLASAGALAAAVQTPGLSRLLGSRPLGPVGWSIGLGGAALGTATALALPHLPLPLPR